MYLIYLYIYRLLVIFASHKSFWCNHALSQSSVLDKLAKEWFEDTKGIISRRKSKDRQCNGQMKKNNELQSTTKKTTVRATRTPLNTDVNSGSPTGQELPAPLVHSSCYSCYKPGKMACKRRGPDCDYYKWNISVFICDTDSPYQKFDPGNLIIPTLNWIICVSYIRYLSI
jgi:hypothetical protein